MRFNLRLFSVVLHMDMGRYIFNIKKDILRIILFYFKKSVTCVGFVELENRLCKSVSAENRLTPNFSSEPGGSRELSELPLLAFTTKSRVTVSI